MSNNEERQNLDNHAGLKLLHDIFGLATCFPAVLKAMYEKKEKECVNSSSDLCKENTCEDTCEQHKKQLSPDTNAFRLCKASLHYTNTGMVYDIYYSGIDRRIAEDTDLFVEWSTKIYKDYFLTAYKTNIKVKEDTDYITRLSFEFYAEGDDKKNNLAVTPWIWDNDMLTFYYEDEDGDKHYVRYLNSNGEISICEKNGLIVTDIISDADRQMFISAIKKNVDNMSQNEEKDDISSYDNENTCAGTDSDNKIGEIFDNFESEDEKCNMDLDVDDEPEDEIDTAETLGDIVCSYGYNVRNQAVRDRNDNSEYAPSVKKLYKDILCKESKEENRAFTKKEWITLFDYMLDNRMYDYSITSSKVVISVSYEDMMDNINRPNYERPNAPAGSNLPWFMAPGSAPKFEPIAWKYLNKQIFTDTIRDHYNFDEVVLIDMLSTDEDPLASDRHCILCTFEAM
jgi:hypothetical protein